MAATIRALQQQTDLKLQLDQTISNYNTIPKPRRTPGYVSGKIETVKDQWKAFRENHAQLNGIDASSIKDEKTQANLIAYQESTQYQQFEATYSEFLGDLRDAMAASVSQVPATTSQGEQPNPLRIATKLPPMEIPKFDGQYSAWRTFHDRFVALIHNDDRLTPVDKLHYLKGSLTGEASRDLDSFDMISANYLAAWELLCTRYNKRRLLIYAQLKLLFNQPKIKQESYRDLRTMLDGLNHIRHSLQVLKVSTADWDPIFVFVTAQRLPDITRNKWEQKIAESDNLPSLKELLNFLENRYRSLEATKDIHGNKSLTEGNRTEKPRHKTSSYHIKEQKGCPMCKGNHTLQYCTMLQRKDPASRNNLIKKYGHCNQCLGNHGGGPCKLTTNCPMCKDKHLLYQCGDFKDLATTAKRNFVGKHNLCYNCLRPHHSRMCTSSNKCFKCGKQHHSLLHEEEIRAIVKGDAAGDAASTSPEQAVTICNYNENSTKSMLATAIVKVRNQKGKCLTLRALIDPGSQSSFMTESAHQTLQANVIPTTLIVTGLQEKQVASSRKIACFTLESNTNSTYKLDMQAYVVKAIATISPPKRSSWQNWSYTDGLELADPKFMNQGRIDLLLGVNIYANILDNGLLKGPEHSPVAQKTSLGWILFGELEEASARPAENISFSGLTTLHQGMMQQLNEQVRQFWEWEEVPTSRLLTPEEEQCEKYYEESTTRLPSGQYQVKLPFRDGETPSLGDSRRQAAIRFAHLEKRFKQTPELHQSYSQCLREYSDMSHMTPVTDNSTQRYYLPHHAVFKESSTTQVRVVFDASAKSSNGKSLNEQLLTGPTLQPKLFATLMNWRKYKYAMTADIEKMYRMIPMDPVHRRYQTILWRADPNEPIQEYELNTVTFGTASAPYLAIKTLHRLATDNKARYPRASDIALSEFYVDDVLTGADSLQEAQTVQGELINLLKDGGFHLRKWAANHHSLLESIPAGDRELQLPLDLNESNQIKALGILWHPVKDCFTFKITVSEFDKTTTTKRGILSEVARLFDPLGWIAPAVLTAKLIMQKLWMSGCDWDDAVSDDVKVEWDNFKNELPHIQEIRLPRWIHIHKSMRSCQLHGFCDASTRAYAAAIYVRTIEEDGSIISKLVIAKTRVAPIKPVSLPRLELCGAVLLSRLLKQTKIDMKLDHIQGHCWTDSKIVLAWLRGLPNRWKTFVANRTVEIRENTAEAAWHYIASKDNPADIASRGTMPSKLQPTQLWWEGPNWLRKHERDWPNHSKVEFTTQLEEKTTTKALTTFQATNLDWLGKFSSYQKMLHIIAYCHRFIHHCKRERQPTTDYLSAAEINKARTTIIRMTQEQMFPTEYKQLQNTRTVNPQSQLAKLSPFLSEDGTLRLGGRLQTSTLQYNKKHPWILQRGHHITNIIIDHYHKVSLHGGAQLVLNILRGQFWIINGMSAVKERIYKCARCTRYRAAAPTQLMGILPEVRVTQAYPFQNVGVDYAGPIELKMSKHKGSKVYKGYFCVFICMATKAIHIEVASDMSTEAFLSAFRRFIGRRGLCTNVYSDNGTNFVGANRVLRRQLEQVISDASQCAAAEFANNGIQWHFSPPTAPHFGGIWEAGVKSIKHHLRRATDGRVYTFEELYTLLTQIESCLNSRPLCALSADPENVEALTPGHFLIGRNMTAIPEPDLLEGNHNYVDRWKHVQQALQRFWKLWVNEYLTQLQQRNKWVSNQPNLEVGQVVIVKDDKTPPAHWPLGKIEELHPGPDGRVRVVTLRMKASTTKRPITKLCPLSA